MTVQANVDADILTKQYFPRTYRNEKKTEKIV
jgi:hypothetical protein